MSDLHDSSLRFLEIACREFDSVARSLDAAALRDAAELIQAAEDQGGRVHVTGIGKPAYVAGYAASLLASTGTPATFLDGTEASHGSAGQLVTGDVVIAISNSGETPELLSALSALKAAGASLIGVTSRAESSLARQSDVVLIAEVKEEGGPLGLAPRSSVLAQTLAVQVLSVELQARRDFSRADYNARHPSGELGKRSR